LSTSVDTCNDSSATIARIIRRLIPFLCLLFIVNYLDRTNVAMAKLQMLTDAHLDERIYGLGAGLFFIGYFIFEVPSNLILERIGARRWIARIMITWGIISAGMMFVRGPSSFTCCGFSWARPRRDSSPASSFISPTGSRNRAVRR
jgi:sugar phosphate permease